MFKIDGSWLTPGEQTEAIEELIKARLLKWDNKRSLPLKMGGFTDIYVNLRDMRSRPAALRYLAELYANPLRRLRVDRFAEVPEAVSPLAGAIATITGLPIVTVREEAKQGRVVSGNLIGDLEFGERVALMDDVVTNGGTKVPALTSLRERGANIAAMVVLVDRQQGWKKMLTEKGFGDVPVWAGMTLHDIRRFLIEKRLMQRCDPAKETRNPVIIALDGKNWETALPIIDRFRTSGCIIKVNDLLLDLGLAWLMPNLSVYGRVMIDPKCHDIDKTVANVCKHAKHCPPWAMTVHASGGEAMMKAAVQGLADVGTQVLAVTVLTSFDPATCEEIYTRQPLDQVMKLAAIADRAGVHGFVCSPEEVQTLSQSYPGKTFVIPGVRSEGKDVGEQKRVGTPKGAMNAGATNIVMGRQLFEAPDPVAEFNRVMKEELDLSP